MSISPERSPAPRSVGSHVDSLGTVLCILLALFVAGFAAFRFAPVVPTGSSQNVDKAFFSSANVVSLTGFTQSSASLSDYPPAGLWLVAAASMISAMTILVGSGVFLAGIVGLTISPWRLTVYAALVVVSGSLVGLAGGVFDAISSATGLGLLSARSPDMWRQTLLVSSTIPGTLGPVFLLVLIGLHRPPRCQGLLAICITLLASVYLVGLLLLKVTGMPWLGASLAAIDTRSLGAGVVPVAEATRPAQWSMMGLMLIGAGPASVAGGLSVLPIAILLRGGWQALHRKPVDALVGVALAWVGVFFLVLFALVIALASSQPQLPGDRMLFLAVSAIGNVGLSHDPISLSRDGMYLLSSGMLAGRLLPLVMLCWMACVANRDR